MAGETKEKLFTSEQLATELDKLKAEYEEKIRKLESGINAERAVERSESETAKQQNEDYLNEYVAIKLFRDNSKYRDDVYVAVNGQNCIIRRGEWVKVRRKFAMVLDQSEIQDLKTAAYLESEQAKFANA